MSEMNRPPEAKEMSPLEAKAESWIRAATAKYHSRKSPVTYYEEPPRVPSTLPKGIERGSGDADQWISDSAGDYEEIVVGGTLRPGDLERVNKLGKMGSQLRGTAADLIGGKWVPNGELDASLASGFAQLEDWRQAAISEELPDPLEEQIAVLEAFEII